MKPSYSRFALLVVGTLLLIGGISVAEPQDKDAKAAATKDSADDLYQVPATDDVGAPCSTTSGQGAGISPARCNNASDVTRPRRARRFKRPPRNLEAGKGSQVRGSAAKGRRSGNSA